MKRLEELGRWESMVDAVTICMVHRPWDSTLKRLVDRVDSTVWRRIGGRMWIDDVVDPVRVRTQRSEP